MFERVVVVGAGVAGLAAVYAAKRRGAEVRLLDHSLGASCLWGGAVDDRPWEQVARASDVLGAPALAGPVPPEVETFVEALDLWDMPQPGRPLTRLATEAGRLRVARGRDRGLLDLSVVPPRSRIVLPRVLRDEWDADTLARSLADDAYAKSRELAFEAVDAKLVRYVGERRIGSADLAVRHDDPARLRWLIERLRESLQGARHSARAVGAVLVGPWLGAARSQAGIVSEALELPVGEVLSSVGNAAGLRFEAARNRLLDELRVEREFARVVAVGHHGAELRLETAPGDEPVLTDRVVLAVGGLMGGGIHYAPPEQEERRDQPAPARVPFALSLRAPVELQAQSCSIDVVSSTHGPSLDELAWPVGPDPGLLEAVGIACEGPRAGRNIYAAGDVMADRPRTRLQAVFSGLRAGAIAAGGSVE